MAAELLHIHPTHPQERLIHKVADCLRKGGIIIYPTDTIYALGCNIHSRKAVERVCRIKGIRPDKANLSCICQNLKIIGSYANHVTTPIYKLMKRALPGPYTFILQASREIPKHFQSKKKTVGIRVVDHAIPTEIVRELGNPILSTTLYAPDEIREFETDPQQLYEEYGKLVDIVIDGGAGGNIPSTVIDCSSGEGDIQVVREGLGTLDILV